MIKSRIFSRYSVAFISVEYYRTAYDMTIRSYSNLTKHAFSSIPTIPSTITVSPVSLQNLSSSAIEVWSGSSPIIRKSFMARGSQVRREDVETWMLVVMAWPSIFSLIALLSKSAVNPSKVIESANNGAVRIIAYGLPSSN